MGVIEEEGITKKRMEREIIEYILLIVLTRSIIWGGADKINSQCECNDDKYLWRKWIKLGKFYHFSDFPQKPIRFRAYWLQRLANIVSVIWGCVLIIFFLLWKYKKQDEALLLNNLFYLMIMCEMIPLLFHFGIDIYVKTKDFQNRKTRTSEKKMHRIVHNKLVLQGFECRKNIYCKMIGEDYLIGVRLKPHSLEKGYSIEYGVVYLPDGLKPPFSGYYDWSEYFLFTKNPEDDLADCSIEELDKEDKRVTRYFQNETHSAQKLNKEIEINIKKRLACVYDKNYVLNRYRNNPELFGECLARDVDKLAHFAGIDMEIVHEIRRRVDVIKKIIIFYISCLGKRKYLSLPFMAMTQEGGQMY